MTIPTLRLALALLLAASATACAAPAAPCAPVLDSAWIRAALPGSTTLAGYAVVRNGCAAPVSIVGADGADFAGVSIHATIEEGGMSHMREAGPLVVAPGTTLRFAPGGSHLMLMQPRRALPEGATTRIALVLADGRRLAADFVVRRDAPGAAP
jgi:copper(I)-binding protein